MSDHTQLSKEALCKNCGDSGIVPVCCGTTVWDANTFGNELCCGNFEAEACDQCDTYEKLMEANPPVRREDIV